RYAEETGFDVTALEFYVAFSYFKIAGIQEGLYARYLKGEAVGEGFEGFGHSARVAVRLALEAADASSIPALSGR
ncbi:MAG: phosphotransferase family protein, partial [Dehalococcoidia bacterium]